MSPLEPAWPWVVVLCLGALVGSGELIARFRDKPFRILRTHPAIAYLLLNAGVSAATFHLVQSFGWTGGVNAGASPSKALWIQALASGLGSMAMLRSSLFRVRVEGQEVDVGPAALVQTFLSAIDREVDRIQARSRLAALDVLAGLKFEDAVEELPALCAGLLRTLTPAQQQELERAIAAIRDRATEEARLRLLALELLNAVGPDLLMEVARFMRDKKSGGDGSGSV